MQIDSDWEYALLVSQLSQGRTLPGFFLQLYDCPAKMPAINRGIMKHHSRSLASTFSGFCGAEIENGTRKADRFLQVHIDLHQSCCYIIAEKVVSYDRPFALLKLLVF